MSHKKTKRQIKTPRKPAGVKSTSSLPLTPLTEALGMMQSGELDVALQLVGQHLLANADDAMAYQLKGLIQHRLKDYPAAIGALTRSLQLAEPKAAWLLNLGMSLRADGQRDEAILVFKQALDCDPSFEPARMQLEQAMQDHPAL